MLSDNRDTLVGMRLVGIDGVIVHERREFLNELNKVFRMEEVTIILITSKLVSLAKKTISELKLTQNEKLIVEIPDRHSTNKIGESLDKYVSDAIGVKL
ncbi:MAG: V-type ATP synthase subunit F [Acholeplasmatales bacterium]|nr:V-type ATP synthase subunit F [Acholeplasmatales bacterium]